MLTLLHANLVTTPYPRDLGQIVEEDEFIAAIHEHAEKFDPKTEVR